MYSANPTQHVTARRLALALFLVAGLYSMPIRAQQAEIEPQTVSNGGEHQEGSFGELFSTIGEPFAGDSVSLDIDGGEATWTGFWNVLPGDTTSGVVEEWAAFGSGSSAITAAAPNPFSDELTVYVRLESPGMVRLTAYDALGRDVQHLIEGPRESGTSRIRWQPEGLTPGTYILRLTVDGLEYPVKTIRYVR